ncbi:MAG: Spy/CpxP family protein refolding chaperone [candidate division KSB1 bacterium]|nr:Spy/CpxP family protein refolding chaperone [candidate division KSB1 bacterium]MDQ7062833.1 Spy/CpxP family protein refolding chaperone [candidate division KSB1 bacterium]
MRLTWMQLGVVLTLMVWSAGLVWAQEGPPEGMHMPMMGAMHGKHMGGLQLTDEQKAKMADLRLELQKEIAPLRAKLVALRTDLKLLLIEDNPNMRKIEARQSEISQVQEQISLARVRHQVKVRQMLTPEQRKKFDVFILSGKKGKRGMHKHAGRPGPRMHSPRAPRGK